MHTLALFSMVNAFYTFFRTRHYRMFEASIDETPATPSAHRVRVDSAPMGSSPLRYLASKLMMGAAEARAHPNAQRDVWEVAVWDPLAISLRLFCLFSPGHVLVYWLFLPTQLSDPRPSVTVVTTVFLTTLLSVQMSFLTSSFAQQAKDHALVHKEVLREYDIKYVHPRTQPLMRDVGTQFSASNAAHPGSDHKYNRVEVYTPTVVVNRGFKTSPNPNYAGLVDPEGLTPRRPASSLLPAGSPVTHQHSSLQTPGHLRDASPLVRSSYAAMRQPQFRPVSTSTGDGGSLGVYSHANSPLKKVGSSSVDRRTMDNMDVSYSDRAASPVKRLTSPLKRSSLPGGASPSPATARIGYSTSRRETGRF